MRFLADESFPRLAIQVLRDAGFETAWSGDTHAGASDGDVLRLCAAENRTLLTFDKDFGELAFKAALPAAGGVLLFRITPQDPVEIAPLVLAATFAAGLAGLFRGGHASEHPNPAAPRKPNRLTSAIEPPRKGDPQVHERT